MSTNTIELLSAGGEYRTALGRMRRTLTYKFDNVTGSTLEAIARQSLGHEKKALDRWYVVEAYEVEGDCVRFTVSRESDQVLAQRERAEQKRREDLQREVYAGLEDLLTNDPTTFSKMLAGELVSTKASTRFSNL